MKRERNAFRSVFVLVFLVPFLAGLASCLAALLRKISPNVFEAPDFRSLNITRLHSSEHLVLVLALATFHWYLLKSLPDIFLPVSDVVKNALESLLIFNSRFLLLREFELFYAWYSHLYKQAEKISSTLLFNFWSAFLLLRTSCAIVNNLAILLLRYFRMLFIKML